jgi:hypothetical protein
MEPQSYGSFGNVSPDAMQAIKEALNRRGMGDSMGALNTQSAGSPTAAPLPPQAPQGAGAAMPTQSEPTGVSEPLAMGGNPEAKLIVGALKERLKAISTIETSGMA